MKPGRRTLLTGASKIILITGAFCMTVVVLAAGFLTWRVVRTHGRVLPNVSIGSVDVGGLTPAAAALRLRNVLKGLDISGVGFSYADRSLTVSVGESAEPSAQQPLTYDIQGMVDAAMAYGHAGGALDLAKANVKALFSQVILPVRVEADRAALKDLLAAKFGGAERARRNADYHVSAEAVEQAPDETESASGTPTTEVKYDLQVLPDIDGYYFDYDGAINAALGELARWRGGDVALTLKTQRAEIGAADAERLKPTAEKILADDYLNLAYDDLKWPIDRSLLAEALTPKRRPSGTVVVGVRQATIEPLLDQVAQAVEAESAPTRFKLTDDGSRVDQDSFVGGQIGKSLDRAATVTTLDDRLNVGAADDVPIVVDTVYDRDTDPLAEQMGIRELLGVGTSNYAGSPTNRQKNIANGAKLLGGLIIKPGEEFSTLAALKPFTEDNGYFPELVIKNNRTKPEVGGGLCQIGTTLFRTTMASGLPITVRQNHSYRVAYYEPAGTDATIYDPAPDFRFVNDTGFNVVVITKVLPKSKLRFEFWGTRDGRVEKQGPIRLWDETEPPPPKLIETSSLAEGKTRCFESAHKGAKTNFTYTITYPDGTVKTQDFFSLYKPWQQQCLVGKTGAPNIVIAKDGSIKELPPPANAPAASAANVTLSTPDASR